MTDADLESVTARMTKVRILVVQGRQFKRLGNGSRISEGCPTGSISKVPEPVSNKLRSHQLNTWFDGVRTCVRQEADGAGGPF